jgi:single-stranded-DNA-specific exonuclease
VLFFTHFAKLFIFFDYICIVFKLKNGNILKYRWTKKKYDDEKAVFDISEKLNIPLSLAKVLAARNFGNIEAANKFFNPKLEDLYDPYIMNDMEKAVNKILEGIEKKLQFWVHGDYDVDGTGSAALLTLFLKEIGANVDYFIPDRFNDGYGLSNRSIEEAIKKKVSIFITVDVGITSYEMLDLAAENGMETIICDHHEPGDQMPKAYAILDPFLPDCPYPFKPLAACGVVFKFIQAIAMKINEPEKALKYLDFVAIASAADMVPLLDENRIMLHYGLQQINQNPRPGFKSLIYCAGLKQGNITTSNIVYAIAPLINAAGRLGKAKRSVEMMIQNDEIPAFRIAQQLEDENRKRRVYDQKLFEEALPIAEKLIAEGKHSLVIFGENWHPGVIGIVASRLVDRFHLPTVLLTKIDNHAKGSARSINNFDMHSSLKECEYLLLEFGGHKHAAGISLDIDKVDIFREKFDEIAKTTITDEMLIPELEIDAELNFRELSPNFFKIINKFAPFGFANPKPVFATKGVRSINGVKLIGMNSIRFRAIQDNFVIDAIGQNLASKIKICQSGKPFSIVYNLETHSQNGQRAPQLAIKDICEGDF